MANDFFRDVGTSLFKPVGDFISGGVTALQPGRVQQMQLERKKIKALLDSEQGQKLLRASQIAMNESRAAAMDRGEGLYGGRGVDPMVKGSEDLGKIRTARDKFADEELAPETAAYFDAAEKSVLDRMKSTPQVDNRDRFAPGDETDMIQALSKKKEYKAPNEWLRTKEVPEVLGLGDYFQASTPTVPEGNVPKTYPQLGIENVDDQATLQEMEDALPDVNMRSEYEADPEMMKKLMELWKAKKLTKQNLSKAFSTMQQTAQQSLGIR